jgi:glycosyltransferase involved in cell wall biosynthesis
MNKICAVIPAYNASRTIEILIKKISRYIHRENIIVVDDGSEDETYRIATNFGVNVVRHERNFGKGRALKTGFEFALKNGFELIFTIDADLQHNPERIPAFIRKLDEGFDIVVGNRMNNLRGMPLERILSNKITSFLISLRTGQKIHDSQCGFRLIKREVIDKISIKSDGFVFESEFLIRSALSGFKIGFVDIETIYNNEVSNIKHLSDTLKFIVFYLRSLKIKK